MVDIDLEWIPCDVCNKLFVTVATMNPRNHKWALIPLEQAEGEGNFRIDTKAPRVLALDGRRREVGPLFIAMYGRGDYRPHNPSHFIDGNQHGDARPWTRKLNPVLAMDDSDDD